MLKETYNFVDPGSSFFTYAFIFSGMILFSASAPDRHFKLSMPSAPKSKPCVWCCWAAGRPSRTRVDVDETHPLTH
jgi:hypothetical protein